jgi:Uma2 family endonuclease
MREGARGMNAEPSSATGSTRSGVEYEQLVALGAFQDERIELLEGALVAMSPIGTLHNSTVQKLNRLLVLALEGRAAVRCQSSFAALEFSEPEPDFAVVPPGEYDTDHPSEAYLIIEVAESSLPMDRGKKLRLYASCGIPEYWVVSLPERCIEVYTEPSPGAYAQVERHERGQSIRLLAFPEIAFAVSDVLR